MRHQSAQLPRAAARWTTPGLGLVFRHSTYPTWVILKRQSGRKNSYQVLHNETTVATFSSIRDAKKYAQDIIDQSATVKVVA